MQYILTDNTLTVILDSVPKSLNRATVGEETWEEAIDHLTADDVAGLKGLFDTAAAIRTWAEGNISVTDGVMYYRNTPLSDNYAAQKAIVFMREGLPYRPLLNFIEKMMDNPSYRAVQQLYRFLEFNNMPLTEDGCFMAYKKVTGEFKDIFSRSIDNRVGQVNQVPRNQVDENPDQTCSFGLHVCGYDYLNKFGSSHGDKVVAVKVNPADVVAVPHDYNNAKMRVAAYEVLEEIHDYETCDPLTREQLWGYDGRRFYVAPDQDDDYEDEYDDDLEDCENEDCEICGIETGRTTSGGVKTIDTPPLPPAGTPLDVFFDWLSRRY